MMGGSTRFGAAVLFAGALLSPLSFAQESEQRAGDGARRPAASPVAHCQAVLLGQALPGALPALVLPSVRRRACECLVSSASLPAVAEADVAGEGGVVPPAFSTAVGRCLKMAIANEPVPAVADGTVRMLLATVSPAAQRKWGPPVMRLESCAKPEYPAAAARSEATGTTRLVFQVGTQGEVLDAQVLKSAGATLQHKMLDSVALSSLMRCRFSPATLDGKPVETSWPVEYVWRLE